MPEGRAERGVEAPAKSIDGGEHSVMMKRVMAVAQTDSRLRRTFFAMTLPRSCP
jgi:hypothetical protein